MAQFMTKSNECEYLIIGGGPAGLQMGYYLEQQKRDYLILEAGDTPGSFFKKFPRHRKLISINKVYTGHTNTEINLRWDWNSLLSNSDEMLFKKYSDRYFPAADDLTKYLEDFANYSHLNIKYGIEIVQISKNDGFKLIDHLGNTYTCQYLIIATGFSKPYVPTIPGIEMAENYTEVSVKPEDFINQDVLIVGKGNSAFETADNLVETTAKIHLASPHPVNMAWKTHYVGHLRAINNNILDTYQLKSQNAVLDATILEIKRKGEKFSVTFKYSHACGEIEELFYDRVIVCAGFRFDDSIFDETCKPNLVINQRFPAQTSEWESTNIKDLYFIGTLMQMRDFKKQMSGFIHGFRYNIRALSQILACKYHQEELSYQEFELTPKALTDAIIDRVNISSALWQQPGFICDLIVILRESGKAIHYQDLPLDYVHEKLTTDHDEYLVVTLEYSQEKAVDPFNVDRIERTNKEQAERSKFLHPIVRKYGNKQLIHEHHILEDLAAEWLEDEHINPLLEFCQEKLNLGMQVASINV